MVNVRRRDTRVSRRSRVSTLVIGLFVAATAALTACAKNTECGPGFHGTAPVCTANVCVPGCQGEAVCSEIGECTCSTGFQYDPRVTSGCSRSETSTVCNSGMGCGTNAECVRTVNGAECVCDVSFSKVGSACLSSRFVGADCLVPTSGASASQYAICGRFSATSEVLAGTATSTTYALRGTISTQPQPPVNATPSPAGYQLSLRKL